MCRFLSLLCSFDWVFFSFWISVAPITELVLNGAWQKLPPAWRPKQTSGPPGDSLVLTPLGEADDADEDMAELGSLVTPRPADGRGCTLPYSAVKASDVGRMDLGDMTQADAKRAANHMAKYAIVRYRKYTVSHHLDSSLDVWRRKLQVESTATNDSTNFSQFSLPASFHDTLAHWRLIHPKTTEHHLRRFLGNCRDGAHKGCRGQG